MDEAQKCVAELDVDEVKKKSNIFTEDLFDKKINKRCLSQDGRVSYPEFLLVWKYKA